MRTATLLAVATLAACATDTGGAREWSRVQRDRLERLHAARRPAAALAGVLHHDPYGAIQDPRHIDQREPQAPGTGPRPFLAPAFSVSAAMGLANVAVRVPGLQLDDRADARLLRLAAETGGGAALELTGAVSETELFPAERISDGAMPAPADASLLALDAFPHARLDTLDGRLRLPLRVGVFADWRHLDHELAGVDRQWLGLGPRVLLEPTWRVIGGEDSGLDVVGRLGGDVGIAWFRERYPTGDDRDATIRWGGEAGLALRASLGRTHVEFGYRVQHTLFGPTDSDLFGDQHRTEHQLQQFFLGLGATF